MTTLNALIFLLSVGTVPLVMASLHQLSGPWWHRSILGLSLTAAGINVQFAHHLWQALLLLALVFALSSLTWTRLRTGLILFVAVGGPFLLWPHIAVDAGHRLFEPQRADILLVSIGFLLSVMGGSVVVEQTLGRIKVPPLSTDNEADGKAPQEIPAGGKMIGMLERTIVYSAVLVGHPEAVAVVIAVKSVARFPEFSKNRLFAEYFLIGSLLSLLVALVVAYLVRAALASSA
jgi:hypothetical protein